MSERAEWWRDGVLYQIYPRSFADTNGDGIGDLPGITAHLDHLEWLGIDGIWLNPTMPSPNDDWGYDVADYRAVDPALGTLEDLDELIAEAGRRGIRVLLDLVPNHTSDRHAWFQDALGGRDARHRDFYVWADPKPDGSPPNNWVSSFGGPAWTLDEASGQFYLHNFLPTQPDLNWWSEEVREAFDEILRFWFDRGVAGWRIDVTHGIVKDRELRDDPVATADDHPLVQARGNRQVFSMNRPEVHDVLRRWRSGRRRAGPGADPRGGDLRARPRAADAVLRRGRGRAQPRLQLPVRALASSRRRRCARSSRGSRRGCRRRRGRCGRAPTTTRAGSPRAGRRTIRQRARLAVMMLICLRGTPFLYYGDEIGLPDVPLDPANALDPVPRRTGNAGAQPRPLPDADAVERRGGRGLHRGRASSRGCRSGTGGLQCRRAARRRAARSCTSRAT